MRHPDELKSFPSFVTLDTSMEQSILGVSGIGNIFFFKKSRCELWTTFRSCDYKGQNVLVIMNFPLKQKIFNSDAM